MFYLRQLFFANFDLKVHTDQGAYCVKVPEQVTEPVTIDPDDYTKLWNEMRENISLVKGRNLGAGQGTFNHIAGGYDAGYYGYGDIPIFQSRDEVHNTLDSRYTYSLVFAADMYATVFKADPLDPARGQRYRDHILRPGGSQDDIESLKVRCLYCQQGRAAVDALTQSFLGREPNSEAFIKELFGSQGASS